MVGGVPTFLVLPTVPFFVSCNGHLVFSLRYVYHCSRTRNGGPGVLPLTLCILLTVASDIPMHTHLWSPEFVKTLWGPISTKIHCGVSLGLFQWEYTCGEDSYCEVFLQIVHTCVIVCYRGVFPTDTSISVLVWMFILVRFYYG